MTKFRIICTKIMYYDKVYYCMSCSELKLLKEFKEKVLAIGDEAFIIDNELYVDDSAFCNISLFDSDNIFIQQ